MIRFYVGYFFQREDGFDAHNWFCMERGDMLSWVNESIGDRWTIEYKSLPVISDFFDKFAYYEVYIVYEDDQHAILHKLRWG